MAIFGELKLWGIVKNYLCRFSSPCYKSSECKQKLLSSDILYQFQMDGFDCDTGEAICPNLSFKFSPELDVQGVKKVRGADFASSFMGHGDADGSLSALKSFTDIVAMN